jgi:hypothetical protein
LCITSTNNKSNFINSNRKGKKMKIKILQKLSITSAFLVLIGCASQAPTTSQEEQVIVPPCAFPDGTEPTPAPDWICNPNFPDFDLVAVASYEQSNMGYDYMETMAISRARNKLAREISITAASSIKEYRAKTGSSSAGNEPTMSAEEIAQKIVSNVELTGSRVLNKARNYETGAIYVVVGISPDKLNRPVDQALGAEFGSESAELQRFKASQSFDKLKSDLAGE